MPSRPPSHEQRLREARPDLARMNQRAESREDRARRMADPEQREANRIRHTQRWLDVQRLVMERDPLCRRCLELGITSRSTSVDHIEPLARRPDLAYHLSNLQGLCDPCHARKSAEERSAAGRSSQPDRATQRKNPVDDSEGTR